MLARTKTRFHDIRIRLENFTPPRGIKRALWEFFLFGFKQGWACLFGGIMVFLLLTTKYLWPHDALLARYDFLFLAAIAVQAILLFLRMETVREAKIILIFHVVGTIMEIFKTDMGSWTYPERSLFHIGHVPLFSGFMYASIGSYLARVNRIFDFRFSHYPPRRLTALLAVAIYVNFFTHHYLPDIRGFIFLLTGAVFGPVWIYYRPYRKYRRMPLILGFGLVAFFIWLAENVGTYTTTWLYPNQVHGWHMVGFGKYGSWFLLMIISFILVTLVHAPKAPDQAALRPGKSMRNRSASVEP